MTSPGIFSSAACRESLSFTTAKSVVGMPCSRRKFFSSSRFWQILTAGVAGITGLVFAILSTKALGMFSNSTVTTSAISRNSCRAAAESNGSVMA